MPNKREVIGYGFIILVFTCLSYLPPYTHHIATAQNPDATIENCLVEFHYPIEWQNFVYDSSNCEENYTEITIPQPSLSEKIPSQITILVEPCCPFKDAEGFTTKNMSLEEYANQQVNTYSQYFTINSDYISLDGKQAFKIGRGSEPSYPTKVLQVSSIHAGKLYTISYVADPADYDTYLPGVQKIVDSFKMLVP